jgi:6-pyruvoyltetrahydropterin/6-carboxytetrahydropterin synthase
VDTREAGAASPDRRVRLTRTADFSASLRIARPDLSDAENEALFGPLARQHGHNYRLEVTVEGVPDPATGMVMDLDDLKRVIEREVMARFDHRDLNVDTAWFEKRPPTPEHFALVLHGLLRAALGERLQGVRLRQDEDLWVEVTGEGEDPA